MVDAIRHLVADRSLRRKLGTSGRDFVRTRWPPRSVAQRYMRIINNDVPDHWWCDPYAVTYVHGVGLSESRLREVVRSVVRDYGLTSLGVDHKPGVRARLLAFIPDGNYDIQHTR
jgi:hypothetical protein